MTARLNKTQPESWSLDAPELAEDNPHALHEHGPRTRAVPDSNPGGPTAKPAYISSVPSTGCHLFGLFVMVRSRPASTACVAFYVRKVYK
jgi:hypothetical protein